MNDVCMCKNKNCVQWRKSARRPSKHERLLKALLSIDCVYDGITLAFASRQLSVSQFEQLIAIKEEMEKGAKI